ncbi:MAG: hypothetical protein ACI87A_003223 [Planctomycetota bacterium]|jgi:hypothetical protein
MGRRFAIPARRSNNQQLGKSHSHRLVERVFAVSDLQTKSGTNTSQRVLCIHCLNAFHSTSDGRAPNVCPRCARRVESTSPTARADSNLTDAQPTEHESIESGLFAQLRSEMESWCAGRLWWARIPLLAYFAYVLYMHAVSTEPYRSMFDGINLGIHELGHPLFAALARIIHEPRGKTPRIGSCWHFADTWPRRRPCKVVEDASICKVPAGTNRPAVPVVRGVWSACS